MRAGAAPVDRSMWFTVPGRQGRQMPVPKTICFSPSSAPSEKYAHVSINRDQPTDIRGGGHSTVGRCAAARPRHECLERAFLPILYSTMLRRAGGGRFLTLPPVLSPIIRVHYGSLRNATPGCASSSSAAPPPNSSAPAASQCSCSDEGTGAAQAFTSPTTLKYIAHLPSRSACSSSSRCSRINSSRNCSSVGSTSL